ncbi:hypothetical protein [Shewanella sp.]|uniref:hypothetical protein n=1 Tax=Shewanella sp. TaxID=50422 RepID=UPI003A982E08
MDKILVNFSDASWWFTGLFFVGLLKLIAILKPVVARVAKNFLRARKYKEKVYLYKNRHNIAAINYQSAKSHAAFVMFLLTCSLYLVWFSVGSLYEIIKVNDGMAAICIAPLVLVELIWIFQDSTARSLVTEYGKVRVKNR